MEQGATADDRPGPWRGRPPRDVLLLLLGAAALVDAIPGYAQQVADFLSDRLGTGVSSGKLAEDLQNNQGVQDFVSGRQEVALRVWDLAIESTGGYVYSRALLATVSAVTTTLFLALIGVPYPLALGFWVGLVSQFIYEVIVSPLTATPDPARRVP